MVKMTDQLPILDKLYFFPLRSDVGVLMNHPPITYLHDCSPIDEFPKRACQSVPNCPDYTVSFKFEDLPSSTICDKNKVIHSDSELMPVCCEIRHRDGSFRITFIGQLFPFTQLAES